MSDDINNILKEFANRLDTEDPNYLTWIYAQLDLVYAQGKLDGVKEFGERRSSAKG